MIKVFEAKNRIFVFGSRAASGYSSSPARATLRLLPSFGVQDVSEGSISVEIRHQLNQTGLGVLLMPNWLTTAWVFMSTADVFTILFGSQAPAGAHVFWEASIMPIQNVDDGAFYIDIQHNQNDSELPIFLTPNWNTTINDSTSERTANSARFYFGSQASGLNNQVMWKIAL